MIGNTESMTGLNKCIDDLRMSQAKMTVSAIDNWSGIPMKAAKRKIHDAPVELTIILDRSYQELNTARQGCSLKKP